MLHDLVLSPLGASIGGMVEAAQVAEDSGFDGVWTFDHFSGDAFGAPHSRDPFVTLAAIAMATERVTLGVLVANMVNRHPVALASAMNSLQSMAPGRVLCGVGSGAVAGSRYAGEQVALGRELLGATDRATWLRETVEGVRAVWSGDDLDGEFVTISGLVRVVDDQPPPPIFIGASGEATVRVAAEIADGVNIRMTSSFADRVATVRATGPSDDFDISVFDALDLEHPTGGDLAPLVDLGVDRRTLFVGFPYPVDTIRAIGDRLNG